MLENSKKCQICKYSEVAKLWDGKNLTCVYCGKLLCWECSKEIDGATLCPDCCEKQRTRLKNEATNEEMYILTSQLESTAMSINSIFQKEDHQEYKTALDDCVKNAESLLKKIKRIINN